MAQRIVPEPVAQDDDDIVVALETARVSEERRDIESAVRWLHRAVSAARRQGRPERAGTITRCILKLGGSEDDFEKSTSEPHVLSEIADDDFTEETIVESSFDLAAQEVASPGAFSPPSQREVAPSPPELPIYSSIRVAVRKLLGGQLKVRPLGQSDKLQSGESEAFLVPTAPDVRF